jgi:hypothetical protein
VLRVRYVLAAPRALHRERAYLAPGAHVVTAAPAWLSRFELEEINLGGRCATFLFRWVLFRFLGWAVYVHKFVADDGCLDAHDHPKRFVSIGLRGEYVEERRHPDGSSTFEIFRAPWVRSFRGTHAHRIIGPTAERPCWTLVIVGRGARDWGFWTPAGWVKWTKYLRGNDVRSSCP